MKTLKYILFLLLLAGSLCGSNVFGQAHLFAFFSFKIIGSLLAFVTLIHSFKKNQGLQLVKNYNIPIAFSLYCIYYVLQYLFLNNSIFPQSYFYILVCLLLLFALSIEFTNNKRLFEIGSYIIVSLACIESIICILQYFQKLPSYSPYFKITGTSSNPNVIGMFLALSFPVTFLLYQRKTKYINYLSILIGVLIIIGIVLLKTRTAIIGIFCSLSVFCFLKYDIINKIKKPANRIKIVMLLVLVSLLFVVGIFYLFELKENSSRGRLFVWKIALQHIFSSPFLGSGLEMFNHDYNLAQANYFSTNKVDLNTSLNASYIQVAYNDFLTNLFEGGIIGLIFFLYFFVKIIQNLASYIKTSSNNFLIVAPVIVSYFVMSLVNFCFFSPPVLVVFIFFTSVLSNVKVNKNVFILKKFNSYIHHKPIRLSIPLITLSIIVFFIQANTAKAYKAVIEAQKNMIRNKEQIMNTGLIYKSYSKQLNSFYFYWMCSAEWFLMEKKYKQAIMAYDKALKLTSNPDVYVLKGNAYCLFNKMTEAIEAFNIAKHIQPNKFSPIYGLLKIYQRQNDVANVLKCAQQIVDMPAKVPSQMIADWKKECNKIIEQNQNYIY